MHGRQESMLYNFRSRFGITKSCCIFRRFSTVDTFTQMFTTLIPHRRSPTHNLYLRWSSFAALSGPGRSSDLVLKQMQLASISRMTTLGPSLQPSIHTLKFQCHPEFQASR
jgi:hypothetical protein